MSDDKPNERRSVPFATVVMQWLTRGAVGLGLFFLNQIYQDQRQMIQDIGALKVQVAVLQERTGTHREATP